MYQIKFGTDGWRATLDVFTADKVDRVGEAIVSYVRSSGLGEKSIIIYGYDYDDFPIEKTISLFEKTTKDFFNISERYSASFEKLVHPVHTRGSVYGWLINF